MDFFLFGNDELKQKGMIQHMVEELDLRYFVDLRNQKGSGQFMAAFTKLLVQNIKQITSRYLSFLFTFLLA